jgi:hypothetical protein
MAHLLEMKLSDNDFLVSEMSLEDAEDQPLKHGMDGMSVMLKDGTVLIILIGEKDA